jgi:TonB family protein
VAAALVLACVVAAVPLSKRFTRASASSTPAPVAAPSATDTPNAQGDNSAAASPTAPTDPNAATATPDAAAAEDAAREARREREARMERQRKLEAKKDAAAQASTDANAPDAAAPKPAPVGPKSVRVSVSYDEAGRVTQTSVVGSSPGAEAYASTAVRVARGRRFPAGKAGSAVVTIPIN